MADKPLVIITGASKGIGKALAVRFSREPVSLLLISRNMQPLTELNNFREVIYKSVDVANYNDLAQSIKEAEDRFGPSACLINNAGILKIGLLEESPLQDNNYEIDVLLKGVMNGIKVVLPSMHRAQQGTIINISSIGDRKPGPMAPIYHACKAAIHSLSESLQQAEAKKYVRVINLAPGFIKTNIHKEMGISFEEYCKIVDYPDFISPEEFAEIVLFCWKLPQKICIRDMVIMPTNTAF